MKSHFSDQAGFSLIGTIVAAGIVAITFYLLAGTIKTSQSTGNDIRNRQIAEAYAVELLENFRSMTGTQLATYLQTNPYNAGFPPYLLCAHINLLNRSVTSAANILNIDPNVSLQLGGSTPLDGSSPYLFANRFYTVQVVDASQNPPGFQNQYCNDIVFNDTPVGNPATPPALPVVVPPATGIYVVGNPIQGPANQNERFFVTVGVSWVPQGGDPATPERITLSTLIPTW